MPISKKFVEDILTIELPYYEEDNGSLIVIEELINVPFEIKRVFTVTAMAGTIRGQHAHIECSQFLICPTGTIKVLCDDGVNKKTYTLDSSRIGILIPPSIWAEQIYVKENSILNVICDKKYSSKDYIREYEEFIKFRKK
jgi:dTDP-4-dehydrorhamnose 3,5-epimerase-like enzyme